jgi:Amt family ammonium transporter
MEVGPLLNGILAGLVSITAGCGDVRPWAAVMMGFIGGIVYTGSSKLQKMLKIDDVVDAGPVHFWCGIWGVLALGLFADDRGTGLTGPGLFYGGGGDLFGNNFLLVINIIWWVGVTMGPLFGVLKVLKMARVSAEIEDAGLDTSKHGVEGAAPKGKGVAV